MLHFMGILCFGFLWIFAKESNDFMSIAGWIILKYWTQLAWDKLHKWITIAIVLSFCYGGCRLSSNLWLIVTRDLFYQHWLWNSFFTFSTFRPLHCSACDLIIGRVYKTTPKEFDIFRYGRSMLCMRQYDSHGSCLAYIAGSFCQLAWNAIAKWKQTKVKRQTKGKSCIIIIYKPHKTLYSSVFLLKKVLPARRASSGALQSWIFHHSPQLKWLT